MKQDFISVGRLETHPTGRTGLVRCFLSQRINHQSLSADNSKGFITALPSF